MLETSSALLLVLMRTRLPAVGTYCDICIAKVMSSAEVSELSRRGNASGDRSNCDREGDERVARRKDVGAVVIQTSLYTPVAAVSKGVSRINLQCRCCLRIEICVNTANNGRIITVLTSPVARPSNSGISV